MTIDNQLRRDLSQDIRRLVLGRMTNDEFDDAYCRCSQSQDPAVAGIAEFGNCLYSRDQLFPYRLKGSNAVDRATRRTAARCVLFLRSGLPYDWPLLPESFLAGLFNGVAIFVGIPTGLILLLLGVPYRLFDGHDSEFWCSTVFVGAVMLTASVAFAVGKVRVDARTWQQWRTNGDYDAWPFLRREDLYEARRKNFLLGHDDLRL